MLSLITILGSLGPKKKGHLCLVHKNNWADSSRCQSTFQDNPPHLKSTSLVISDQVFHCKPTCESAKYSTLQMSIFGRPLIAWSKYCGGICKKET